MADGDPLIIGKPNTGSSQTSLTTNVEAPALFVENTGFGTNSAIYAKYDNPQAGGPAIAAQGNVSGLHAVAKHKDADAIVGEASSTSGTATGVQGVTPRSLASCVVFMASLTLVLAFVGTRYPDSAFPQRVHKVSL